MTPSATSEDDVWVTHRLRAAIDAAGVALWSWNVDTGDVIVDRHGRNLWDLREGPVTLDALSAKTDPLEPTLVRTSFEATRRRPGPYSIDFRIRVGNEIRWICARGVGADEGITDRIMSAIFMDVTERREADEARELLAGEMSHRVKNLFAIASSLTAISARSAATTAEMARDLTQRLSTLGRAHDLIRRDKERLKTTRGASLGDLFAVFLSPYDAEVRVGGRIRLSLPVIEVGDAATTTLALIVHELATNSAKYGALSTAEGSIEVSATKVGPSVTVVWRELGGREVPEPKGPGGFGSRLVSRSVAGQLGGTVSYDWLPSGPVITLCLNSERLAG